MIRALNREPKPARLVLEAVPAFVFLALLSISPVAAANRVAVDCDAGESLAGAIAENPQASIFWIAGTCREDQRVVIERDGAPRT